eukprot:scaffold23811_cov120-Isochrysis_galbana.AAC.1
MSEVGSLPHSASGVVVASGVVRAPDSAGPTAPQSNVTAAPGIDPGRENASVCQAPGQRHRWARCTGRVQRQQLTLGHVAVLCPCLNPPG